MVLLLLGCTEDVDHGACEVEVESRTCMAQQERAASASDERDALRGPTTSMAALECDVFAQDCPAGEKCVATASEGSPVTDGTQCVPVDPDAPRLGEACTRDLASRSDDCEAGTTCWFTGPDVATCVELCSCSAENPVCTTPGTQCVVTNTGTAPLCLPVCNPLDPEACGEGIGCYAFADSFYCVPDISEDRGGDGYICRFRNECKPGLACMDASVLVGCAGASCCTSYCEPGNDDPCRPGMTCVPWYGDDPPTDSCLAAVGICRTAS